MMWWRACAVLILWHLCAPCFAQSAAQNPRAEDYASVRDATLVPPGRLAIDGRRMRCGASATVLDARSSDFGGAYRDFLVLNPARIAALPTAVKRWIYAHECAHLSVGRDETKADCAAVQRGRREGWLDTAGLAQICEFMQPARADQTHFAGPQRCASMQRCFAAAPQR